MPVYNQQLGTEELKTNLEQILRKQQNQKAIQVQVHPENVAGVDKFLASLIEKGYNTHFTVHGDETLSERGCKMCWDHGGAVVDPKKTAEEFLNVIQQMLAGSATTSHDGDVEAMPIEINNENENTDLEDIVENPDG